MIVFNYHKNINNILIGMQLKFLKLIALLKFTSPADLEAWEKNTSPVSRIEDKPPLHCGRARS
jgi:hypothetical protein